jgi:excisionase family DNA binding protein
MDTLWDITTVAKYLGVSERTVYNRVRAGELPAIKFGRLWRVRQVDLEIWLESKAPSRARPGATVPGPYPYASVCEPLAIAQESAGAPTRGDLEALLAPLVDSLARRLAFVGLLSSACEGLGWPAPVVVGGHAVEFYTAGDFPTVDIDLAGASEPISEVLEGWGFAREGRHHFDQALNLLLEVPGGRLAPDQLAHVVAVRSWGVTAYVLGVEDLVVDRLAACAHWDDEESCLWARVLLQGQYDIDRAYLLERARAEDVLEKLAEIEGRR